MVSQLGDSSMNDESVESLCSTNCEKLIRIHLQNLNHKYQSSDFHICEDEITLTDISGDMNHVYRVYVTCASSSDHPEKTQKEPCPKKKGYSVIVKMAPVDVLYLKEEVSIPVDPKKIFYEYAALIKFHQLHDQSVPMVHVLDIHRKAIIMEDMHNFKKLSELLISEELEDHMSAIKKATCFIGSVHKETWLSNKTIEEKSMLLDQFNNSSMRHLMSELLFDRPFDPRNKTNRCNPKLYAAIDSVRNDVNVMEKVAVTKKAFLNQNDCLCHGDFATDNILVNSDSFRIIDLEFSGVGLRAYDLALFLQMVMFQLILQHHKTNQAAVQTLFKVLHVALKGYTQGAGGSEGEEQLFVDQVCSLIACEFMWTVFGSYCLEEFDGQDELEHKLLSLAKSFLLLSDTSRSIAWNINRHLTKVYGIETL